jgi:biotin transport system substrate-specific component
MSARPVASTVSDLLWPAPADQRAFRAAVLVLLGSLLMAVSAKVQIPFYPVPMTLQPLVALLLGIALGPRLGAASVVLYLVQGAAGLPIFAGTPERGIGLAYMVGPTGGYLIGFALAAYGAGWLARHYRSLLGAVAAALAGLALIYLPGVLWLSGFVGAGKALTLGLLPFVPGDLVKAALAVALTLAGNRALARQPTE